MDENAELGHFLHMNSTNLMEIKKKITGARFRHTWNTIICGRLLGQLAICEEVFYGFVNGVHVSCHSGQNFLSFIDNFSTVILHICNKLKEIIMDVLYRYIWIVTFHDKREFPARVF